MTQQKTEQKELSEVEVLEAKIVALNTANAELTEENKEIKNNLDIRVRAKSCKSANNYHVAVDKIIKHFLENRELLLNKYVESENAESKFIDLVVKSDFTAEMIETINKALKQYFKSLQK